MRPSSHIPTFATILLLLTASACAPTVNTHGHNLDLYEVNRIQPGKSSQEEVLGLLGTPSAVSTFDEERWYYVTKQVENVSFYQSDLIRQDVVIIEFNEQRIVTQVSNHGKDQAVALLPDPNETQTLGNELTIVQQLLGNVGRFNTRSQDPFSSQGSAARR